MNETSIPELVAHRGYLQKIPENSWRGLEAALRVGAAWLEFDIQLCSDGGFVLLHDDSFTRTAGVERSVFGMDSRRIDISVHEPGRFAEYFAPTPVPLLTDVLRRLAAYPGVRAMVELKQQSIDHWGLESVMRNLLPLLRKYQSHCVLISFNREALEWCQRGNNDIQVGWVLEHYNAAYQRRAEALAPGFLICNEKKIAPGHSPWPGPWRWMLYDITDPGQALDWAAHGVGLIETAAIGTLLQDPLLKRGAIDHGF